VAKRSNQGLGIGVVFGHLTSRACRSAVGLSLLACWCGVLPVGRAQDRLPPLRFAASWQDDIGQGQRRPVLAEELGAAPLGPATFDSGFLDAAASAIKESITTKLGDRGGRAGEPVRGETVAGEPVVGEPGTVLPLPIAAFDPDDRVTLQGTADRVTLVTRDAELSTVLAMIAQQQGLNVVTGEDVSQKINVSLRDVPLAAVLDAVLSIHGLTWASQDGIITVTSLKSGAKYSPEVQGRIITVFNLDYVLATEVDKVVKGLLSPVGQSFVHQTSDKEQRSAQEQLIVEDLPAYVERIARYLAQVDVMPRQVVVEANILQVALKDENRHGVNFNQLARVSSGQVSFETYGLASGNGLGSAVRLEGGDLTGLIELIKATTDTKTLASPKLTVVNGQEARISVGGKIGYLLTTATNVSTLQSVEFLDYGVELKVTPIITLDGRVLLTVAPQVSTARINPTNELPESEATELQTRVMLSDGQAIVIGGLITETNSDSQNKIPVLGDMWLIGRLFQARNQRRERSEIIVTLLPRIVDNDYPVLSLEPAVAQAGTPLMDRNLRPLPRQAWEGELVDASDPPALMERWLRRPKPKPVPRTLTPAPVVGVTIGPAPVGAMPVERREDEPWVYDVQEFPPVLVEPRGR
jgi:type IV pilus assembly protein PilQ